MVRVAKKKDLNVHIENVYSEYYYTKFIFVSRNGCIKRFKKDIFIWRNSTTGQLIGSREIFRIGNNYVNLCLN